MRIIHPVIGLLSARWAKATTWLVCFQVIAGLTKVALGAPAWLQLIHSALADTLWTTALVALASTDWTSPDTQGAGPTPANE